MGDQRPHLEVERSKVKGQGHQAD